jgi:hypothetical protein
VARYLTHRLGLGSLEISIRPKRTKPGPEIAVPQGRRFTSKMKARPAAAMAAPSGSQLLDLANDAMFVHGLDGCYRLNE